MEKPIEVILLKQAEDFTDSIDVNPKKKLFQAIRKTKERLFGQWFTKLKNSDGIFEFRIDDSGKYYRLFAFWDTEGEEISLVVATHGLIKKTNKTPPYEIRKAEKIKREYFEEKNKKAKK
ncbi:MAG: type II toxin-antitoxin system RelE/ParE family toxin [Prolixibacteraceae bacterium]|jgi:phage-related protein|nr:type II toxin-antitoxin system RelE/ParE family toxin [Prolixibacteraceae bacterium]